jgi:two-component system, sensor histidine kinase
MIATIRRSLRAKVIAAVLLTTFAALVVAMLALLLYEIDYYRRFLAEDTQTQAEILARTNAPALAFNDPSAAAANLALLDSRPDYLAAAIYTLDGRLFARYDREGIPLELPAVETDQQMRAAAGELEVFLPIVEDGTRLGTVYVRATYDLGERLQDYLLILTVVTAASLLTAGIISLPLAGSVTRPVLAIADVARKVIDKRDFALRAPKTTEDETGGLVDAFNAMLAEVDERAEALEASNSLLKQETNERRNAEAALRAADRRKDEFLATLAHELRNPLAPMVNAMDLLNASRGDPHLAQQARDIIGRQLKQLVRLVDDLLDVSRITSGKLTIRKEIVSLGSVVQNATDTVRPAIDSRGFDLRIELPREPVFLHADPVRLAQVITNLLNNAIKYSAPGGRITLSAETPAASVRIRIEDTGAGISAEALPTIFEMFSQGDNAQTGLGVGLALARRLVELHGGSITAASPGVGRGSTFTLDLPITVERPAAPPEEPPHSDLLRHRRILLVDDNTDFAASLAVLLQRTGHTVRVAHTARSAISIAREFRPEFAFLDLGLPDINGYTLARHLHALPETADTVLVAVSGWGQPEDRRRSREAGFALHLVKPVALGEIESAMSNAARSV